VANFFPCASAQYVRTHAAPRTIGGGRNGHGDVAVKGDGAVLQYPLGDVTSGGGERVEGGGRAKESDEREAF